MKMMDVLIECENALGWRPAQPAFRGRAVMHKVMSTAILRKHYTVDDLVLALNYCKRKKIALESPLQLLPYVPEARALAADTTEPSQLDRAQADAIAVELMTLDEETNYWVQRLNRAQGAGLEDLLAEWNGAGRARGLESR